MEWIDLRSDTVTRPTQGMLDAMMHARVGDDVFSEDPAVNELEEKAARMFGKEAAIFCASGTMTNQIAIKVHTNPGDEVICSNLSHIYHYEGGGIAFNSGASVRLIEGDRGRITAAQIEQNINADNIHFPISRLVSLENTVNRGGGSIYDFHELQKIHQLCKQKGLKLHLDGARLFNALVETGHTPAEFGPLFDTISICLSKSLGAPVGSLLIGSREDIKMARRIRKVFGGGWRQAGFLAAAGIYALEHHIQRLKEDHLKARNLASLISGLAMVTHIEPVDTNILIFNVDAKYGAAQFVAQLEKHKIKALDIGYERVRMVTHLDITDEMMDYLNHTIPRIF